MERSTDRPMVVPSAAEPEDAALIRAAQTEPEAFGLIYQRYVDRVFAYTRARLANGEDAADLTQQIFVRAFQALPRYRPRNVPFAAWLFRIAANAVTDHGRRRRPMVALQFLSESQLPRTAAPIRIDESERAIWLRQQIARLSERDRELLALRFAAGLSAREIAAATGRSEAAVQKQLSRTISTLKEHYRAHGLLS